MRKKIIIGNWKMNKNVTEAKEFAEAFVNFADSLDKNKVIVGVAPTFLCLETMAKYSEHFVVSSQNAYNLVSGAYTGEVSATMLKDTGINWAIIGHSERRGYFHETNQDCNLKLKELLRLEMNAIYCVGETLDQYEANKTKEVIKTQVLEGLEDIEDPCNIVIAYEPVWSIGTGKSASKEIAEDICGFIRETLADKYGIEVAEKVLIQYGGSVKPENVKEYLSEKDIDGVLVGGASLKVDSFTTLINNAL